MAISPATAKKRAQVAALSRDREKDDPELVEARRDLCALSLTEHVQRVLSKAPPLTNEQRDNIAALLRAGATA